MRLSIASASVRRFKPNVPPPAGGGGAPAYMSGVAQLTWAQISNTSLLDAMAGYSNPGGSKQYIYAYSGAAFKRSGSRLFVFGGGHNDYAGNEIPNIILSADAPSWSIPYNPSTASTCVEYYGDGKPASRHTYSFNQYLNGSDEFVCFGGGYYCPSGYLAHHVDVYNPATNTWSAQGTHPNGTGVDINDMPCAPDGNGDIWLQNIAGGGQITRFNAATKTWTTLAASSSANSAERCFVWDPARSRMIRPGGTPLQYTSAGAESSVSFTGPAAGSISGSCSAVYCDDRSSILICNWGSNTIYEAAWNGSSYVTNTLSIGGTPPAQASDAVNNLHNRFFYSPDLKAVFMLAQAGQNVHYFRTGTL